MSVKFPRTEVEKLARATRIIENDTNVLKCTNVQLEHSLANGGEAKKLSEMVRWTELSTMYIKRCRRIAGRITRYATEHNITIDPMVQAYHELGDK